MSQRNTHHLERKKESKEQIVVNIKTIKKQANDTSGKTKTTQDRNKNNPNHSTDKTDKESSLEYSSSDESINTQTKIQLSDDEQKEPRKSRGLSAAWKFFFRRHHDKQTLRTIIPATTIRQKHFQTTIQNQTANYENNINFGHHIEQNSEFECFLFHNINGLKDEHNWIQINATMKDLNVTCFGFSELNTVTRGINF
jgi:hypothetical protein